MAAGIDSSTFKPPCDETVLSYDTALTSMPDLVLRACQAKKSPREASNTSIRSILTFICAILISYAYVSPSTESIPPEYCFGESKVIAGCKLARRLVAESLGVLEQTIQCISKDLYLNHDDMAIYANFQGDVSCKGSVLRISQGCWYTCKKRVES